MTERIEQLLQAGNETSARVRNLWITFLLFGTYLAIAIGSTTHRQMLLEAPIVLPILGAELPLVDFYQVAPVLFLVFHFYLMVQLYLLAQKLHLLEDAITGPAVPKGARGDLRARTDNFLITQLLVGKTGGVLPRLFIRWAAWLTMIFAPVLLLLAFQVQFLAYHDVFTTWLHRATLIADVLIVWLLWPVITHPGGRLGGVFTALFIERPLMFATLRYEWQQQFRHAMLAGRSRDAARGIWRSLHTAGKPIGKFAFDVAASVVLLGGSLALIGFSVLVATIPAEEMERWLLDHPLVLKDADGKPLIGPDGKEQFEAWWLGPPKFRTLQVAEDEALPPLFSFHTWTSQRPRPRPVPVESEPNAVWWPTALLFEGEPDQASSKATSLFSRNLMLIDDIDLVTLSDADLANTDRTLILRDRDLRYARFDRADMRKADMFGSNLTSVSFFQADLSGANMDRTTLVRAYFKETQMLLASFRGATAHFANFDSANAKGADFSTERASQQTEMQGSIFTRSKLTAASFVGSDLSVVNFRHAHLHGADFSQTTLHGAYFVHASLPGSNFSQADLEGAYFSRSSIWGTRSNKIHNNRFIRRGLIKDRLFAEVIDGDSLENGSMLRNQWVEEIQASVGMKLTKRLHIETLLRVISSNGAQLEKTYPNEIFWNEIGETDDIDLADELISQTLVRLACRYENSHAVVNSIGVRIFNDRILSHFLRHHQRVADEILQPTCSGNIALAKNVKGYLVRVANNKP